MDPKYNAVINKTCVSQFQGFLTLKWNSKLTRNGKLMACRIRFSFNVCSTCFSLTTWSRQIFVSLALFQPRSVISVTKLTLNKEESRRQELNEEQNPEQNQEQNQGRDQEQNQEQDQDQKQVQNLEKIRSRIVGRIRSRISRRGVKVYRSFSRSQDMSGAQHLLSVCLISSWRSEFCWLYAGRASPCRSCPSPASSISQSHPASPCSKTQSLDQSQLESSCSKTQSLYQRWQAGIDQTPYRQVTLLATQALCGLIENQ